MVTAGIRINLLGIRKERGGAGEKKARVERKLNDCLGKETLFSNFFDVVNKTC